LSATVSDAAPTLTAVPRLAATAGLTGGIEFPTHIFLGSAVATVHLVHEVAHQWSSTRTTLNR
jgi:hypothetical protein